MRRNQPTEPKQHPHKAEIQSHREAAEKLLGLADGNLDYGLATIATAHLLAALSYALEERV